DVNNATADGTEMTVFAICGKAPKRYQVRSDSLLPNAAHSQSRGIVACPAGTVPFGGGAQSRSSDPAVNLGASFPLGNVWDVDVNNGSWSPAFFDVFVVCGKQPKGYVQLRSAPKPIAPGAEGTAEVDCPAPTVPLGGGGTANSPSTAANLNSLFPGAGFSAVVNNASAAVVNAGAAVICA